MSKALIASWKDKNSIKEYQNKRPKKRKKKRHTRIQSVDRHRWEKKTLKPALFNLEEKVRKIGNFQALIYLRYTSPDKSEFHNPD